jgi:hypoxanthine phosphoribosyltransferase
MINSLLRIFYSIYPKYQFISYQEVNNLLEKLKIDFDPDLIIGVLNGGYYPANKIADIMNKKLEFLRTGYYSVKKKAVEFEYFPLIKKILFFFGYKEKVKLIKKKLNVKGKKILVVDDECGTGKTLRTVKNYLKRNNAKIIKTAVLINYKKNKIADYWVESNPKKICIMPWTKISPYYIKRFNN